MFLLFLLDARLRYRFAHLRHFRDVQMQPRSLYVHCTLFSVPPSKRL